MELVVRILHLEDDENDAELVQDALLSDGIQCQMERVETRAAFLATVEQHRFDIILADFSLPAFDGLAALAIAQVQCPDVPFIFVSGAIGEERAIEILKQGATDYVLKHRLSRLGLAVRRALREVDERHERRQAAEALRQSRDQLEAILHGITEAIVVQSPDGRLIYTNEAATQGFGAPIIEALLDRGTLKAFQPFILLDEQGQPLPPERLPGRLALQGQPSLETLVRCRNQITGEEGWVVASATPIHDALGNVQFVVTILRDLTERMRLYEAEKVTRQRAEATTAYIATLQVLTSALSEALTPAQVAQVVMEQGLRTLEASAGSITLLDESKTRLVILQSHGYPAGLIQQWQSFDLHADVPLSLAVRSSEANFFESVELLGQRFPHLIQRRQTTHNAFASLPLIVDGRAIGGIGLSFDEQRIFSEEERAFMLALARQCAQALERARLYEAEQAARAQAEAAQQRLAFLAEASAVLGASLDYETNLNELVRLVVPDWAGWCGVILVQEDGQAEVAAAAHVDDGRRAASLEIFRHYSLEPEALGSLTDALCNTQPQLHPYFDALLETAGEMAGPFNQLRQLEFNSLLVAPLSARERMFGALALATIEPNHRFDEDDLALAVEVARRAALAVDNARLYRHTSSLNAELEQRVADRTWELQATNKQLQHTNDQLQTARAQLERRAQHLAALSQMGQMVTATLDLKLVLKRVLEQVSPLSPAEALSILLVEGEELVIAAVNSDILSSMEGRRRPVTAGIAGEVIRTGQPVWVANAGDRDHLFRDAEKLHGYRVQTLLAVPVRWHGRTVGVIEAIHSQATAFKQEDISLLGAAANWAAIALGNARLYEAEQQARDLADTLRQANLTLSETLDLDTVLETLLDCLNNLVAYDSASVMLWDGDAHLSIQALRGQERWANGETLRGLRLDIQADANLRAVFSRQQSLLVPDTADYPGWQAQATFAHVRSWLGVPLLAERQFLGLFALDKCEPAFFNERHQEVVEALAAQAAIAIQKAQLYRQVLEGRERLRQLTQQVVSAQEEERRRVSRELHDEAGQALTALKINLSLMRQELPGELEPVNQRLSEAVNLIGETMDHIRLLAQDLRPPALETLGLNTTLEGYCRDFGLRTSLAIDYTGQELPDLPGELIICYYRFLQEALTNVAKHAQASQVQVSLTYDGQIVRLQVSDNGQGFDTRSRQVRPARSIGIGLMGMQERLELVGGRLLVESNPDHGTRLLAETPWQPTG